MYIRERPQKKSEQDVFNIMILKAWREEVGSGDGTEIVVSQQFGVGCNEADPLPPYSCPLLKYLNYTFSLRLREPPPYSQERGRSLWKDWSQLNSRTHPDFLLLCSSSFSYIIIWYSLLKTGFSWQEFRFVQTVSCNDP